MASGVVAARFSHVVSTLFNCVNSLLNSSASAGFKVHGRMYKLSNLAFSSGEKEALGIREYDHTGTIGLFLFSQHHLCCNRPRAGRSGIKILLGASIAM